MRRIRMFVASLSFAICLAAGVSIAQPYEGGGPRNPAVQRFIARFHAANTTHDGRLTLAQAEAANFQIVIRHFGEVDIQRKGYITLEDVRAYRERTRPAGGAGLAFPPPILPGPSQSAGSTVDPLPGFGPERREPPLGGN